MKSQSAFLGAILVVVVTGLSGLVQGKLTNRWGIPESRDAAGERLKQLPTSFGDWRLEGTGPINQHAEQELQCGEDFLNGTFVNQTTRERLNVFIVLGSPGPISVHTPEVCYSSRDYEVQEETTKELLRDDMPDEFFAVTMRKKDLESDLQRVYWAWGNKDRWVASRIPRIEFGGSGYLFKIQVAGEMRADTDLERNDVCANFLKEFLPIANPILFAPQPVDAAE